MKVERIQVVKTVKFGKGKENTYYKGVVLSGKDITPRILSELHANTGTLKALGGSGGAINTPQTEIRDGKVYTDGVLMGDLVTEKKEEVKTEKIKTTRVPRG